MSTKKNVLYGTASVAALALPLTACGGSGGSSASGGTWDKAAVVNIGSLYEPQNLDNTAGGGQGVTEALNGNVYEGLFGLADDGKVDKLLAQDYEISADGLTYTFTLRDGVKFHSGKELTSQDVKYSLEKVLADESQSARKSNLEVVKDIATPDARTVRIALSKKSVSFVYNLSYVWIINSQAKDLKTTEDGTGPYTLDKWTRGSALSLNRFAGYWGDAAANKQVVFHYYKDATALNNALRTPSTWSRASSRPTPWSSSRATATTR
ncbi:ABC transporter substrate-binding protein [Streptomyces atroolivaceus]|uniref:ABC transporter substrate-binding protein n=1 Tax=Streptomyces atroolivaceus TaxID=66869 RepID=UPI00364E670A